MLDVMSLSMLAQESALPEAVLNVLALLKVVLGFTLIIFVHEAGHFIFAKWFGVKVDRFAVGFGPRLFGWRRGEGFTTGSAAPLTAAEIRERKWGETDYCLNAIPLGGYVKMLGEEDIEINEETGEIKLTDDPRAFTNRPVWHRMIVVSAGVIFNILFAGLMFLMIFMIGTQLNAPLIGAVAQGSPAERAGLERGDRVAKVNGWEVHNFEGLLAAQLIHDEIEYEIIRDGQRLPEPIRVKAEVRDDQNYYGVGRPLTALVGDSPLLDQYADLPEDQRLMPGDRITHANGVPLETVGDIQTAVNDSRGMPLTLTVERAVNAEPGTFATEDVETRPLDIEASATLALNPTPEGWPGGGDEAATRLHLLGFYPPSQVRFVQPGMPAAAAGFQAGDVILSWDNLIYPRHAEITEHIQQNPSGEHVVRVRRDESPEPLELRVTPHRPFTLFGTPRALVGIGFMVADREPVVGAVEPGTAASAAQIPAGSRFVRIGDTPVESWSTLTRELMARAGSTVPVTYRFADVETTVDFTVPSSVYDVLDLPFGARILSVRDAAEQDVDAPVADDEIVLDAVNPLELPDALRPFIGKTVVITWQLPDDSLGRGSFDVTEDNLYPWQRLVAFGLPIGLMPKTEFVHAGGNPLRAMMMGANLVQYWTVAIYQSLWKLVQGGLSTNNLSGPVGIVTSGVQQAREGDSNLLMFLALMSINLAVINFLPLPVVDGGQFVFLLIEAAKGSPVPIKWQMGVTLAGIAFLLLVVVFVTIQDIGRLIG